MKRSLKGPPTTNSGLTLKGLSGSHDDRATRGRRGVTHGTQPPPAEVTLPAKLLSPNPRLSEKKTASQAYFILESRGVDNKPLARNLPKSVKAGTKFGISRGQSSDIWPCPI